MALLRVLILRNISNVDDSCDSGLATYWLVAISVSVIAILLFVAGGIYLCVRRRWFCKRWPITFEVQYKVALSVCHAKRSQWAALFVFFGHAKDSFKSGF
jgi:hypothetical protein